MKNITIDQMSILTHALGVNVHDLPKEVPHYFNQNRYVSGDNADLLYLKLCGLLTSSESMPMLDDDRYWRVTDMGKEVVKEFISINQKQVA